MTDRERDEMVRLRAELGASADALLARRPDPGDLLGREATFLSELGSAGVGDEPLRALWRELRNRALALAADLPPTDAGRAVLRRALASDAALMGETAGGTSGN